MEYKINKKAKSELELVVTFTSAEITAKLELAGKKISENIEIKGFRKGKAPLDKVIEKVGEMMVYEHAGEILVRESYPKILIDEKIEPLTQPKVDFEKLAAGNDFVYKATVTTVPKVEPGDLKSIKVKDVHAEVSEQEVQKVIDDLKNYSATEALENKAAEMGDKVEIDFNVLRDGVPIEGGQGNKYPLILGSKQMIPGFEEAVVGMKAGEERDFELSFPKEYHNKNLAGKKALFKTKVHGVFKRTLPQENESFAVLHGHKTFEELKKAVHHNLEHEKQAKGDQKLELEIIEKLISKSKFSDIPDALVNQELDKMVSELKQQVMMQGLPFEDYLKQLRKDELTLRIDLADKALERVKAALLTRAIFLQNNMVITDEELNKELENYKKAYAHNEGMQKALDSAEYREMIRNIMGNSKVMAFLKNEVQIDKK